MWPWTINTRSAEPLPIGYLMAETVPIDPTTREVPTYLILRDVIPILLRVYIWPHPAMGKLHQGLKSPVTSRCVRTAFFCGT